jgi:3-oxoacyl-[acyl-carrier protein] reductase
MDLELKDKVAMVSAASKGLGKACAQSLAREGARVSICARNREELARAEAEVGPGTLSVVCDVSKPEDLERWHRETEARFGPVDILVTNTGGPPAARFQALTEEQWAAGVQSTLMNVIRSSKLVIPGMQKRGGGRIIHITSLVAKEPLDDLTISSTLRMGLSALTKTMANQFGPDGITVNAVLPGHVHTDRQTHLAEIRSQQRGITPAQYFEQVAATIPLRRVGEPREVGDVVAFLASGRASYITGTSLLVDGGITKGV